VQLLTLLLLPLQKLNAIEARSEAQAGGRVPGFLRTHPVATERVSRVRQELPAAYQEYQDGGCAAADTFLGGWDQQGGF
jgi:predicted Zn-dependent protease